MGRGRSGDLSAALCYQRSMAPASQGGIGDGCAGLPCKAETDSMSLDKLGKIGYYSKRMVQDSGFRIQDSGFRIQDSGFRSQESGARKKLRRRVSQGQRGDKLFYSLWTRCRLEKGKEKRSNFKN